VKTRKRSQRQEKGVAGLLLGRTVPASGAVRHGGYDVRKQGELTIECKYTSKKSYTLKLEDLQKVKAAALRNGAEKPLMTIRFVDVMHGRTIEEVVVMSLSYFEELRAQVYPPGPGDDEEDEDEEDEDEE
jgi:Holliday junction resolvase